MIHQSELHVQFGAPIHFNGSPSWIIYRKFLGSIKRLTCFAAETKCFECSGREDCKYFRISGENFEHYPGILVQSSPFEERDYGPDHPLYLRFLFIGKAIDSALYLDLFAANLYELFDIPVACRVKKVSSFTEEPPCETNASVSADTVSDSANIDLPTGTRIRITSPIESADLSFEINNMLAYYNEAYGCEYSMVGLLVRPQQSSVRVSWPDLHLPTRRVFINGLVNDYQVGYSASIPAFLLQTGIGKWNFIGGGKIEIEN